MMNWIVVRAFLVALLTPYIVAAIVMSIETREIVTIPFGTKLYAMFAYPFALVLGIPAYLISKAGAIFIGQGIYEVLHSIALHTGYLLEQGFDT